MRDRGSTAWKRALAPRQGVRPRGWDMPEDGRLIAGLGHDPWSDQGYRRAPTVSTVWTAGLDTARGQTTKRRACVRGSRAGICARFGNGGSMLVDPRRRTLVVTLLLLGFFGLLAPARRLTVLLGLDVEGLAFATLALGCAYGVLLSLAQLVRPVPSAALDDNGFACAVGSVAWSDVTDVTTYRALRAAVSRPRTRRGPRSAASTTARSLSVKPRPCACCARTCASRCRGAGTATCPSHAPTRSAGGRAGDRAARASPVAAGRGGCRPARSCPRA
jgi:hypothetical protein